MNCIGFRKGFLIFTAACIIVTALSCSCAEEIPPGEAFNASERDRIMDTLDKTLVLAVYEEEQAFSIILANDTLARRAHRISYRHKIPLYIDNLELSKSGEYRSLCCQNVYVLSDSTVTHIYEEKIVHPSSNWQGQTPGKNPHVMVYKRMDRKK